MHIPKHASAFLVGASVIFLTVSASSQTPQESMPVLNAYGPGGPLPAMKDAAATFGKEHHVQINVVGGPAPNWIRKAKQDADIIFSGSEDMMSNLQLAMQAQLDPSTIQPLYLRKAAILVRPGNPRHISGLTDLIKPGFKVLVVNGAGQEGLWEDVAARKGDIRTVASLRANIKKVAANSGIAREEWVKDTSLDAWITWTIWQVSNPTLADRVPIVEEYQIYRDCGVGLTNRGKNSSTAHQFIDFLKSREGVRIFKHWGWETAAGL